MAAAPDQSAGNAGILMDGRYLTDHYPGIGRYVFNLAKALSEGPSPLSISLLIDATAQRTRFDLGELERRGVVLVPTRARLRTPGGEVAIRRLCRARRPAVFHATHLFSPLPTSCPTVLTVHDVIPLHDTAYLPSLSGRLLYRWLLARALRAAGHLVTGSQAVTADLARLCGVTGDRVTVTPYGVDTHFAPASPGAVAEIKTRLGLPDRYVLYVGADRPHKNVRRLVEAWARVRDGRRDEWGLVVAGPDGPDSTETRRLAARLVPEAVRFTGMIADADLPALYSGARLAVQPAECEGFGLPLLEAMACGTPVACSRIPALVEVGEQAVLHFDPSNLSDMAAAIRRGLDDERLRSELAARGLARAGRASWARTAEQTREAYRHAQGTHTPGGRPS